MYKTKEIEFRGRKTHIILQNENGPCPLIATCNVLILRNDMTLYPYSYQISQERVIELVSQTLIDSNSDVDTKNHQKKVSDAIDRLPCLADGINVDIKFRIDDFEVTPELAIFGLLNIPLYHGWIVDPQDMKTYVAIGCKSYNDLTAGLVALETQTVTARSSQDSGECSVDLSAAVIASLGVPLPSGHWSKTRFTDSEDNTYCDVGNKMGENDNISEIPLKSGCTITLGSSVCQESKSDDQFFSTDCDVENKINVGEDVHSISSVAKSSGSLDHDQLLSSTGRGYENFETENNCKMASQLVTSSEAKTNLESTKNDSISEIPLKPKAKTFAKPDTSGRSQDEDDGDKCEGSGSPAYEGESLLGKSSLEERDDTNGLTLEEGKVIKSFLDRNASQLTFSGISYLLEGLKEGELCVFFRNNHFATMLKYENKLYLLVNDLGYLTQRDLVWEELNQVNGDSVFMTGDFKVFTSDRSSINTTPASGINHKTSISDLPEDVFLDIYARFKATQTWTQRRTQSPVCRTWWSLLRKHQTTLVILESPATMFPLRARGFESLVSITVDHRLGAELYHELTDADLAILVEEYPRLQRLEILGCQAVTPGGLAHFVRECPGLLYLHIQLCTQFDDDSIIGVVRSSVTLEELTIAFLEVSSSTISSLRELIRVDARGCPLSEARVTGHPI